MFGISTVSGKDSTVDREPEMILNTKKTKAMVFNFTDKYQFRTRLTLKDQNIEIVDKAKLLGVIITDDLKWEENTAS